jgi:hypothetical protein
MHPKGAFVPTHGVVLSREQIFGSRQYKSYLKSARLGMGVRHSLSN